MRRIVWTKLRWTGIYWSKKSIRTRKRDWLCNGWAKELITDFFYIQNATQILHLSTEKSGYKPWRIRLVPYELQKTCLQNNCSLTVFSTCGVPKYFWFLNVAIDANLTSNMIHVCGSDEKKRAAGVLTVWKPQRWQLFAHISWLQ